MIGVYFLPHLASWLQRSSPAGMLGTILFALPTPVRGSGLRSADDSPEDQALYKASGAHCTLGKSRAAVPNP